MRFLAGVRRARRRGAPWLRALNAPACAILAWLAVFGPAALVAQTPQNPSPPRPDIPQRQEMPAAQTNQFVPIKDLPQKPEIPSAPLLYGAYAFVWGALVAYLFVLWRRISRVERELADVNRKLVAK